MTAAVDESALRDAAATFCTGVAVITAMSEGEPVGMSVQSFVSLSIDPPLASFSPSRTSRSWPRIRSAGRLAVNVLAADQSELSRRFAVSGGDKFHRVDWERGENGAPLLAGALTCFEADIQYEVPGGDHTIAIVRLTRAQPLRTAEPLVYFRRGYHRIAATDQA
ncbi:flavin reductase family protein [Streptomyces sp. NPDC048255]|uniref:flavin reductase family protein n=1 Tax=Streptomyces sp. NPDC048255 TaxID=3154713 RepID=UPI0033E6ACA9